MGLCYRRILFRGGPEIKLCNVIHLGSVLYFNDRITSQYNVFHLWIPQIESVWQSTSGCCPLVGVASSGFDKMLFSSNYRGTASEFLISSVDSQRNGSEESRLHLGDAESNIWGDRWVWTGVHVATGTGKVFSNQCNGVKGQWAESNLQFLNKRRSAEPCRGGNWRRETAI